MDFSQVDHWNFPYLGEVIWLTAEQGGRSKGIPPAMPTYRHLASIPPADPGTACGSFVLRGWDPTRWRSEAEGMWLYGDECPMSTQVQPGTVLAVTEGLRLVAYFTVREIRLR